LFFFQYVSDYVLPLTTKKLTAITTQSITQKAILFGLEDFELNDMAASKSRWNPFLVQSIQMVCLPLTALQPKLYLDRVIFSMVGLVPNGIASMNICLQLGPKLILSYGQRN
jgi:hypothetical protein